MTVEGPELIAAAAILVADAAVPTIAAVLAICPTNPQKTPRMN